MVNVLADSDITVEVEFSNPAAWSDRFGQRRPSPSAQQWTF
jgi:hypothetical protein